MSIPQLHCTFAGDLPDGTKTEPRAQALQPGDVVLVHYDNGQWRLDVRRLAPGVVDKATVTFAFGPAPSETRMRCQACMGWVRLDRDGKMGAHNYGESPCSGIGLAPWPGPRR